MANYKLVVGAFEGRAWLINSYRMTMFLRKS